MIIRPSSKTSRSGLAIIVVFALIALVLVFVVGNARTLHYLSRNVKLIEEKQMRQFPPVRPPASAPVTNQASALTNLPPSTPPPSDDR